MSDGDKPYILWYLYVVAEDGGACVRGYSEYLSEKPVDQDGFKLYLRYFSISYCMWLNM